MKCCELNNYMSVLQLFFNFSFEPVKSLLTLTIKFSDYHQTLNVLRLDTLFRLIANAML